MLDELKEANSYIYEKLNKLKKDELIVAIEKDAIENNVPIITPEVAEYLKFYIRNSNIKNILEIGTATGYSAILMAKECLKREGNVVTIEIDEKRREKALININKSGLKNIKSILGDASDVIPDINEKFDFIFIDASKGQYLDFFNKSYEKLDTGGIIFIDNIMFRGYLYKEEKPKKYRTIIRKLDEFIDELYQKYDFILLPFGDGIGIVKK